MTRRKEDRPMTKHTLLLFDGDFAYLQRTYPEVGASKLIRTLVRAHVEGLEAKLTPAQVSVKLEELIGD